VSANDPLVSIVDDDASVLNSTRRLLRSFGIRAAGFSSARAFLNSSQVGQTACLILDVRMPEMNGLELQRELSRAGHRFPVVFVTAYADNTEEEEAMQAGATRFLRKPVSEHALIDAIECALGRKLRSGGLSSS
jgi:FixJ family two-component response regulator